MKCLLIEDEPLAMLRLKEYVQRVPFLEFGYAVDNGLDALPILQTEQIDLIFLDIQMDGFSGLQLLESLPTRPAVILTTAFDQYALKAFDLKVDDYLLKPYTFERFLQAVMRVQQLSTIRQQPTKNQEFIFIKTEHRLQKIMLDEILYIEGMSDYRRIHLENEKLMTLETFGGLEQKLPVQQFCRVHRSFMVSLQKIETIERDRIKILRALIPVSATYRDHFYKLIGRPVR